MFEEDMPPHILYWGQTHFHQRPWDPIPPWPKGAHAPWPHNAQWMELRDYKNLRENVNPENANKPLIFGYLSDNRDENMNAQMLGKRPKPICSYYLYVCRECGRLFISRQPYRFTRKPDCGCVIRKIGKPTQTVRLEGREIGWLIVSEYVFADGRGLPGGWKCICLGIDGNCQREVIVPTQRLLKLRTLACEQCSPEDWNGQRGGRPLWSVHARILNEHRKRQRENSESELPAEPVAISP